MINISEELPVSMEDIQTALKGVWGTDESDTSMTEIALGTLNVRLYLSTKDVSPLEYTKGATVAYARSLAIISFMDGTSAIETLTAPKTYTKTIKMGVLVARQT